MARWSAIDDTKFREPVAKFTDTSTPAWQRDGLSVSLVVVNTFSASMIFDRGVSGHVTFQAAPRVPLIGIHELMTWVDRRDSVTGSVGGHH
jgi:hypothetical protein